MGGILGAIIDPLAVQRETRQQDLQAQQIAQRSQALALEAEQQRITNEQHRRALKDMDILSRAYVNTDRSPMAVQRYAITNGITPAGWKSHVDALSAAAKMDKEKLDAEKEAHAQVGPIIAAIDQAPEAERVALIQQHVPQLNALEPGVNWPAVLVNPDQRKASLTSHSYAGTLLDQAEKVQKIANEKVAEARRVEAEKRAGELAPLTRAHTQAQIDELARRPETAAAIAERLAAADAERARHNKAMESKEATSSTGTWQLQEDDQGNVVEYNTKTGQVRKAPGLKRYGTAAKEEAAYNKDVAPVEAAMQYVTDYQARGKPTGPGDEALMEKFFELARPSTGFRMTQPQQAMLQNARSWLSGAEARIRHLTTGTYYSDEQRQQIIDTMKDLGAAKRASLKGGRGAVSAPVTVQAGGKTYSFPTQEAADKFKQAAGIK